MCCSFWACFYGTYKSPLKRHSGDEKLQIDVGNREDHPSLPSSLRVWRGGGGGESGGGTFKAGFTGAFSEIACTFVPVVADKRILIEL